MGQAIRDMEYIEIPGHFSLSVCLYVSVYILGRVFQPDCQNETCRQNAHRCVADLSVTPLTFPLFVCTTNSSLM